MTPRISFRSAACLTLAFASTAQSLPSSAFAQSAEGDTNVSSSLFDAGMPSEGKINAVRVEGNVRTETATVLSYLGMKQGDSYTQEKGNDALKRLFGIGLFSDVSLRYDDGALIVHVEENPAIRNVAFEGNKRMKDEDLQKEISLAPRAIFTKANLQRDVDAILQLYRKQGRYSATVEPKVIRLDRNRLDLVYEIYEGKKTKISKIYFVGNEIFSDAQLKDVITSSEERWYRFFSSADVYDQDRMNFDQELLRRFYLEHGYIDFKVLSANAEISRDKGEFILTFAVEEGNRYRFGDIELASDIPGVDVKKLGEKIQTKANDYFNNKVVSDSVDAMTEDLNEQGYTFVDVRSDVAPDRASRKVKLSYRVKEGEKSYVNNINISGNVRTLDRVIRREMRIAEGDPYSARDIKRSEQRIKNLGFFNKAEIKTKKTPEGDKADLDVEVSERSTGELNFGAGYSTTEGALGNVSLRERNFLGKGQDARIGFQRSTRGMEAQLSFTEPYFMDRDLSLGFDIFRNGYAYRESSFDSDTQGGAVRMSYPLTEYLRHSLRYSLQQLDITDVRDDASAFIRQQEGTNVTSLIDHTLTYDKRDSAYIPTEGYYLRFNQGLAGVGGDSQYVKHEGKARFYYPLYKRDVILMLGASGGHIFGYNDKNVRINERFFIGGNDIRGFDTAGIGPRGSDVARPGVRDSLGGNTYYAGTVELEFPLGLPEELGIRGAAFVDGASLFNVDDKSSATSTVFDDTSLRASAGVGLSWRSPMGPIRLDLAAPFMKEDYDETQFFRFNFGTRF
ncbi:MAG: outer membrane protein assembly factor BamA [Rickettsiales bacterium]